ncbi:MAG: hypothetical protein N4A49_16360, partial [Marinifilaceae bacterium]|nr:hypothetical protein [Marinifilaceae bacterium]
LVLIFNFPVLSNSNIFVLFLFPIFLPYKDRLSPMTSRSNFEIKLSLLLSCFKQEVNPPIASSDHLLILANTFVPPSPALTSSSANSSVK